MNWKLFFQGLAAAASGGAITAVAAYVSEPSNIQGTQLGKRVGTIAAVGALISLAAYFKQSPLPPPEPPKK